jgi:Protein of unknown function (DUF3568)
VNILASCRKRAGATLLLAFAFGPLAACAPLGMTAMGIGASTGISHTMNGITYRTVTASVPRVHVATLGALKRMGFKVESDEKTQTGDLIKAAAGDRQLEIELEAVSSSATRIRAVVKTGALLYDGSTATEVILQTEKLLKTA